MLFYMSLIWRAARAEMRDAERERIITLANTPHGACIRARAVDAVLPQRGAAAR